MGMRPVPGRPTQPRARPTFTRAWMVGTPCVHDRHLRALQARVVEVLHRDRLVVGRVGAEEDDEVALHPVAVRAGGRAVAERLFHGHRGGGVAQPRRVVHVGGAHRAGGLLSRVVMLVQQPARGDVHGEALPVGRPDLLRRHRAGFVPRRHAEPLLAAPAHHRLGKAAQRAQIVRGEPLQRGDIGQAPRVERGRRVQPHQLQPHHAQVDAVHRPIAQAGGAQRAPVAHALAQDAQRVRELVAVGPGHARHLQVVVGLLLAGVAGDLRGPEGRLEGH